MKRQNVALVAVLALALSLVAFGTVAYLSDAAHTTNVITTGKVDIDLIERQLIDNELRDVSKEGMTLDGILPGQTVSKQVSVKNQDNAADAWVRVKVETNIWKGNEMVPPDNTLVRLNIDAQNWLEQDGYYYYTKPLPTNQETPTLFTEVAFDGPGMTNDYQGCQIKIEVSAQAVQVKNNDPRAAETDALTLENLQQVSGWPSTTP